MTEPIADECLTPPSRHASTPRDRALQRVKDMFAGCRHYLTSGFCLVCAVDALEAAEQAGMGMADGHFDAGGWPTRDGAGN